MENSRCLQSLAYTSMLVVSFATASCSASANRPPQPPPGAEAEPTLLEKKAACTELFRLGKEQARVGDSLRAQEYFAMAIDSGGDTNLILPELMRAAISGMRYQVAIRYFEDFGDMMSRERGSELATIVGVLYLGIDQPERARAAFEGALRLSSKNARAHFLLGQVLRDEFSDYAGSDLEYRSYLALEPSGEYATAARAGMLTSRDQALAVAEPTSIDAIPVRIER